MKTWTAPFTTKVEKLQGEQPCKLVHINYGTSSHLYLTDADQTIVLGGNTYYPYILSMGSLSFEMPEEDVIGTVANLDIQIMRNATTDVLLNNLTKNRNVEIWQYFIGLADADKLALASLIIENIVDVNQSQFTLKLKQNELKLKEIPDKEFNKTDYPFVLEENIGIGVPIVLGDVKTASPYTDRKSYRSRKCSAVAGMCSDKNDFKFLGHKLAGHTIAGHTPPQAFKFESGWGLYAYLESDGIGQSDGNIVYAQDTSGNGLAIDLNTPFATYPGTRRKVFIPPDIEGQNNQASQWKNASDENSLTACNVDDAQILQIGFSDKGSFLKNADVVLRYVGFRINSTIAGGTATFYWGRYGGTEYTLGTGSLVAGYYYTIPELDLDTYELSDYYLKVVGGGGVGASVTIDDCFIELVYKDGMDTLKKIVNASPAEKWAGHLPGMIRAEEKRWLAGNKINELNEIFFEMGGINTVIQPISTSYTYNTPIYCLYALLKFICGLTDSEIDGNSTDSAYSHLNTLGLNNCGWQIKEKNNASIYLRELLTQSMLGLFRGYDNKWKLFKVNKAESTIPVFRDLDQHDALTSPAIVYQMTDFKFYQSEVFYNKFILNSHYNTGLGNYDSKLTKDRINDTDLATSYSNYNNDERLFELDCNWLRQSTVVTNLFTVLKKWWKQTKLIVEFDTNLVGTKLELGDTIEVNHKAQTWQSDLKNFQVIGLGQTGNTIHVKGIEIML